MLLQNEITRKRDQLPDKTEGHPSGRVPEVSAHGSGPSPAACGRGACTAVCVPFCQAPRVEKGILLSNGMGRGWAACGATRLSNT